MTLSKINQRRFERFKANRKAVWSFWIFTFLFVISLFAEFVANDKPLMVSYDDQIYFPVFKSYPETTFGGEFETETEYTDPFVQDLINEKGWILFVWFQPNHRICHYRCGSRRSAGLLRGLVRPYFPALHGSLEQYAPALHTYYSLERNTAQFLDIAVVYVAVQLDGIRGSGACRILPLG